MNDGTLKKIVTYLFGPEAWPHISQQVYPPKSAEIAQTEEDMRDRLINSPLTFNPKEHGMTFGSCVISSAGMHLKYSSERFQEITVTVLWDYSMARISNYVIARPIYTEGDWAKSKTISQRSWKIKGDGDMRRMFKSLYGRFECPTIDVERKAKRGRSVRQCECGRFDCDC